MTPATGDDVLPADEHAFGQALDRLSPGLLALARCFAPDDETAEQMVVDAWRSALDGGALGARLPVALARRMSVAATDDAPSLVAARRRLRVVLASGGGTPLPLQRDRWSGRGPLRPAALDRELSALPPALRVALVLHDVHRWAAADLQALLGVGPRTLVCMLGEARGSLGSQAVGEAV
jgi:DNA-directed RNA polymerase specialized sigma24 family protein